MAHVARGDVDAALCGRSPHKRKRSCCPCYWVRSPLQCSKRGLRFGGHLQRSEEAQDTPATRIDLRVYAADSVNEEISKGSDLLGWAINFGHPVLQRDAYWGEVMKRWRGNVPLPSVDVAIRRAVEALHRMNKVLDLGDADAAKEQAVSYVTHLARAELIRHGVYPASRPELPTQLRDIGSIEIARFLEKVIDAPGDQIDIVRQLAKDRSLIGQLKQRAS